MKIIPAIDICNGNCVRLIQGDFSKETVFSSNPIQMAKQWEAQGAQIIHVIDLDGAKEGSMKNLDIVKKIIRAIKIPIQIGGGIRAESTVQKLLDMGVQKVVLGTMILEDQDLFKRLIKKYQKNISVALDGKFGKLVTRGWVKETNKKIHEIVNEFTKFGVENFIYTDVIKDGMMTSPNFLEIEKLLQNKKTHFTISGGISSIADLIRLKNMGVSSVIIGRALYEKKITFQEALYAN